MLYVVFLICSANPTHSAILASLPGLGPKAMNFPGKCAGLPQWRCAFELAGPQRNPSICSAVCVRVFRACCTEACSSSCFLLSTAPPGPPHSQGSRWGPPSDLVSPISTDFFSTFQSYGWLSTPLRTQALVRTTGFTENICFLAATRRKHA